MAVSSLFKETHSSVLGVVSTSGTLSTSLGDLLPWWVTPNGLIIEGGRKFLQLNDLWVYSGDYRSYLSKPRLTIHVVVSNVVENWLLLIIEEHNKEHKKVLQNCGWKWKLMFLSRYHK